MTRKILGFALGTAVGVLVMVTISTFAFHDPVTTSLWVRCIITMVISMSFTAYIVNRRQKKLNAAE